LLAYRVLAPGVADYVELPIPDPGPGEVLIRVAATGVCHSDVAHVHAPPGLGMALPVTLGHEIVGEVAALGAEVASFSVGQQVMVYVLLGCGRCAPCRRGEDNLCRVGYRGFGSHLDGGMAEYVVAPARSLVDAGGLSAVDAAPLADAGLTAFHAVSAIGPLARSWDSTVVVGVGGLGHMAIQIARCLGSSRIIAVDRDPSKLELARTLGVDDTVLAHGDAVAAVTDLVGGREVDVVLDFVGTNDTLGLAAAVTNRGSAIGVVGLGGGALAVRADFGQGDSVLRPEVSLRRLVAGSRRDLEGVLELARAGRVGAHTARYRLSEAHLALADTDRGCVRGRAVLTPEPAV
jgi:propanol-preferring alcohol dehydrogenase